MLILLLFGRVFIFFAVWAGGALTFLLFGWGTGIHSLTSLPGSSLRGPTTKKMRVPQFHFFVRNMGAKCHAPSKVPSVTQAYAEYKCKK